MSGLAGLSHPNNCLFKKKLKIHSPSAPNKKNVTETSIWIFPWIQFKYGTHTPAPQMDIPTYSCMLSKMFCKQKGQNHLLMDVL